MPRKKGVLYGAEKPRIFTPPLRRITRSTSLGFEAIEFAESVLGMTLFPWQKFFLKHCLEVLPDGRPRFRVIVLMAARQQGKGIDLNEDILTGDGWKKFGQLEVGDKVHAEDGTLAPVSYVSPVHNLDCYRVTFADGSSVVCDQEHQWTVWEADKYVRNGDHRRVRGQWVTVQTPELMERYVKSDRVYAGGRKSREYRFSVRTDRQIQRPEADLPIDPYFLGYWLGDGSSDTSYLTVGHEDLPDIRERLDAAGYFHTTVQYGDKAPTVRVARTKERGWKGDDTLRGRLRDLGILNNKHVPELYMLGSESQRLDLLCGLMDSDGYVNDKGSNRGRVEFCSTNKRIAEGVKFLAKSLGWRAVLKEGRASINGKGCGVKYRVTFGAVRSYSPFGLTRKHNRLPESRVTERVHHNKIVSVERIESRPTRCIQVDHESHQFLVGRDLIPTHNTEIIKILTLWKMYIQGATLTLGTAQKLDDAEEVWKEVLAEVQDNPFLNAEVERVDRKSGATAFTLVGDRRYKISTANRKGGRGRSVDGFVVIDELREQTDWQAWSALSKTTMAKATGQVIAMSNAGDAGSVVLRTLREKNIKAIEEGTAKSVGHFEYSAPEDCAVDDREAWAQANPSLGWNPALTEDVIESALESDPESEFRMEVLCQWWERSSSSMFPEGKWLEKMDVESEPIADAPLVVSIAAWQKERTVGHASISAAGVRADGDIHVEVVSSRPGLDWTLDRAVEIYEETAADAMVIQARGSVASRWIADLRDRGVNVLELGGGDITIAHGTFYQEIMAGSDAPRRIWHVGQENLTLAANEAGIKPLGGMWVFDLDHDVIDIDPLVGCVQAAWGLRELMTKQQRRSAYEDSGLVII